MKVRILKYAAFLLALLMPMIIAISCREKDPPKTDDQKSLPSESPVQNEEEIFAFAEQDGIRMETEGNTFSLYVGNEVDVLQLSKMVKIAKGFTWMLATDISMQKQIPNKIVQLAEGENVFYVYCRNSDETVTGDYVIRIYRTAGCLVAFEGIDETQSVMKGERAALPAGQPQKEGYDFDGWSFNFDTPISESVTISAKWRAKNYTVTLNPSGGNVKVLSVSATYGEDVTFPDPTKEGYVFAGWYYGEERIYSPGAWMIASNVTLTARWASDSYTVSFDPDGGNYQGAAVLTVSYGDEITFPLPIKDGYNFGGWFDKSDNETLISDGSAPVEFNFTRDLDLIAHWNERASTITFYENSGSKPYTAALTFGSDLPVPVRSGFTFGGWFSDEKLTKQVTAAPENNARLYAWWTEEGKPGEFVYSISGLYYRVTARVEEDSDAVVPAYIGGRETIDAIPRPNPGAGVYLESDELHVHVDRTGQINAHFTPRFEGEDETLTYSCSKPSVAQVDQFGWVTGLSKGMCVIKVSNEATGMSAECMVDVNEDGRVVPSLSFDLKSLTIACGKTITLNCSYQSEYPDDDQTIVFTSADETVAQVDENGTITALTVGTCDIYAKDVYGVAAVCTVTVYDSVQVTLIENNGENARTETLEIGSALPVPERDGFTFGGWFGDIELTEQVAAVPEDAITLYAWWTEEGKPGEFVYEETGDGYTVTARVNEASEAVVPAYIGGKPVIDAIPAPETPTPGGETVVTPSEGGETGTQNEQNDPTGT